MTPKTIAQFLGSDHDRLHAQFHEYQALKTTDRAKAVQCFSDFRRGLARHILWEEGLLFTRFEAKMGMPEAGPTVVMRAEHRRIEALMGQVEELLQQQKPTEAVETELFTLLDAHNMKEEKILYPWIDHALNDLDRNALIDHMRSTPACTCCGVDHEKTS